MAMKSNTQRSLLFTFIGSIMLCGVIGIYCLLVGRFSDLVARVLGTTATVGAAAVLGLSAAIPWERKRWQPIGPTGIVMVAVALLLMVTLIWADTLYRYSGFIKTTFVSCVPAVALPHIGLLSLARLRKNYELVRIATVIAIIVLALQIMVMVIFEYDDDFLFRVMGAIAILDVCGTIAVPILHRISAIQGRESVQTTALDISLTCPRCSIQHRLPVGRPKCPTCGLQFSLAIEEEHCQHCGYVLYGIDSSVCPECGKAILPDS